MADMIRLNDYQDTARRTMVCPEKFRLVYCALKLSGEAGEVSDKVGKSLRDGTTLDAKSVALELGDVLWYVAMLAKEIGYDLQTIAEMNIKKLTDRAERGVLAGSGDNR